MAKINYPLKQVMEVKERRVEEAEKIVLIKQQALKAEEEKLKQQEAARDQVKKHRSDKLTQLREELDHSTTSPKVQQMKAYLKIVDERLVVEEKKVEEQKKRVETATKELEDAKHELNLRRLEVEKLVTHRTGWIKEKQKELELAEEREMDEIGNVIHGMRNKGKREES